MAMLHAAAIVALVLAGGAYALGAWWRWRALGDEARRAPAWPPWIAFALLGAAFAAEVAAGPSRDLAHALLGLWAGAAALHLVAGALAGNAAALLLLPAGALAVLAALAALLPRPLPAPEPAAATRIVALLHVCFMALHLGAALVAGAAGALWLLAARQLKTPSLRALALPPLPRLERLAERALVAAAALLTAGLACGGAALEGAQAVALAHPSVAAAGLNLVLMAAVLALRAGGRLGRRGLAVAVLHVLALAAVCAAALLLVTHA